MLTFKDFLQMPITWLLVCVLVVVVARWKRWRLTQTLAAMGLVFWYLSITPLGASAWLHSLTWVQLAPPPDCAATTAPRDFVILPGGLDWWTTPNVVVLSDWSKDRADTALAQLHANDRVLIPGSDPGQWWKEADVLQRYLLQHHVDAKLLTIGPPSSTTYENLQQLRPQLRQRPVILVTSFWHMPRAQRAANHLNITVCPLNTKEQWQFNVLPAFAAHWSSKAAIHEWLGLMWYAMSNRN